MPSCSGWICGSEFLLGGFCGTARLCGGESSGDQWSSDSGVCFWEIFSSGRAVAFFGGLGILFGALLSPASLGILTLLARQRFNPFLGREQ
jgi:hypothetical protein